VNRRRGLLDEEEYSERSSSPSLSLSLTRALSSRRSFPSLCSVVDESSVEIEIQSTPKLLNDKQTLTTLILYC